jgi:hypothetical protein
MKRIAWLALDLLWSTDIRELPRRRTAMTLAA